MNESEVQILLVRMLTLDGNEFEPLRSQLDGLRIERLDSNGLGSFRLVPKAGAQLGDERGVFVDAEAADVDGECIYAALRVNNGRLSELDIFRGDGAPIARNLSANDWQIVFPRPEPHPPARNG